MSAIDQNELQLHFSHYRSQAKYVFVIAEILFKYVLGKSLLSKSSKKIIFKGTLFRYIFIFLNPLVATGKALTVY